LHFAAIPDAEIIQACERFNLPLETWQRQERTFGLLRKVYARRAQLRGQQPLNAAHYVAADTNANAGTKNSTVVQNDPVYLRWQSFQKPGFPADPEHPDAW
jgi:hypothetical protein